MCEAALASARMGCKVLLLAIDLDKVAAMPCSPSIGGMAKGQLVKEIDALGGEMAKTTDKEFKKKELFGKFKPKGQMPLDLLVFQSVLGPIGLPATEAVYPAVAAMLVLGGPASDRPTFLDCDQNLILTRV